MTTTSQPRAGALAWVGLGLLIVPVFMTAIDMTVLFLATPTIAAALEPTASQQLWMLHIGDIASAGLVLTVGRLVDRLGPRLLLVLGAVAYGTANLLAAYAPSIEVLVAARALIGVAAVSMMPAGMALIRRMFAVDRQLSQAVAIFMGAFSGGVALGPPIGGVLLENFWWGSIFLVNVPVVVLVVLAARILPKVPGSGTGSVDVPSVLLSLAAVVLVVHGGQELAAQDPQWTDAVLLAVGVGLGALFVRRQRRLAEPLLDLSLFRRAPFTVPLLSILLVIVATAGADMQLAQHLQVVLGHPPFDASLILAVPAVVAIVTTVASSALLRWMRPSVVMGGGVLVALAGAVLMANLVVGGESAPLLPVVLGASMIAAGAAPIFPVGANLMLRSAPVDQTGSAMASQDLGGSLGNALGLAAGGTIAFLGYQSTMRGVLPEGLDAPTRELAVEGAGPALSVAQGLPDALGAQVAAAATDAFAVATRNTYVFAAIGLAVLAVLILWGLRHARVESDAGAASAAESASGELPGAGPGRGTPVQGLEECVR